MGRRVLIRGLVLQRKTGKGPQMEMMTVQIQIQMMKRVAQWKTSIRILMMTATFSKCVPTQAFSETCGACHAQVMNCR